MATVTKVDGGRAMMHGQLTDFRETWIFENGKKGTARIYIRVEACSEEQRRKNRERVDAAVRELQKSAMLEKKGA
jgi:hypothetical protein